MKALPRVPAAVLFGTAPYPELGRILGGLLGAADRAGRPFSLLEQMRRARWAIEARHPRMALERIERLTVRQVLALLGYRG